MKFILKLLLTGVAAYISARILPGITLDGFTSALFLVIVLAILNAIVRPVLVLLTIPVTILTLGLFLLVINALMVMLASYLLDGFEVSSFFTALLFSIVLSVITAIVDLIL